MTGMFKLRSSIRKFAAYGLILVLILGIGFTNVTAYADNAAEDQDVAFSDVEGHWAKEQILDWSGRGLVAGYADGTFGPERGVTRAEFITFVNRAYGLKEKASTVFVDVSSADWFVDEVAKAVAAEYISGYDDGTMRPNAEISRLEAAVILYRLLRLESYKNESWLDGFNDSDAIADWGRVYVNSAVAEGYFSGYPDGTFKPGRVITRAETVSLLSKAVGTLYNVSGVYGPAEHNKRIEGNVTVSVSGVTLKDLTIEGDLFLTAGIGDGDFEADGVVVKGRTIIGGGGHESIVFNNSTLGDVIVYVVDGKVRVVAKGDTSINDVILESGGFLQEENLTGEGFGNVQILVLKPGQEVELDGDFDSVDIEASVEMSVTGNTRIKELNVSEGADGTEINLGRDTVIDTLTLDGGTDVTGKGTIKTANINTDDYSFERDPDKTVVEGKEPEEVEEEKKEKRREPSKKSVTDISVDDVPVVGMTIKAKDLKPADATVDYQWQRAPMGSEGEYGEFENIEGATDATYVVDKYYGCGNAPGNGFVPMMYIPEEVIRLKVTGTGNYRGTVYSDPVGPIVEGTEAVFNATGAVGIAPDTAGEAAGKIFAEYELSQMNNGNGAKISLKEGEIDYIKVQVGDENWRELEPNTDETLWFNVKAETGARTFVVKVTESGDATYYTATLDWEKEIEDATWLATGREGTAPHDEKKYVEYKLVDSADEDISLKIGDVKLIAQKVEGKWKELTPNTDETLWFPAEAAPGEREFFVVTDDGTMYKAILDWQGGDGTASAAVVKAEGTKKYSDIVAAEALVDALADGDAKNALKARIQTLWVDVADIAKIALDTAINEDRLDWDILIKAVHFYDKAEASEANVSGLTNYYANVITINLSDENTSVYDISTGALRPFTGLKTLNLSNTGIKELGGLVGMTELETLDISDNPLEELNVFWNDDDENTGNNTARFASLKTLDAKNIATLESIAGLVMVANKAGFDADNITWDLSGSTLASDPDNHIGMIEAKFEETSGTFNPPLLGEITVSKLAQKQYAPGESLTFTIRGLNPDKELKMSMMMYEGRPLFEYEPVDLGDSMTWKKDLEDENEPYRWFGDVDEYGRFTVTGTVYSDLAAGGELHIILPQYGGNIENSITLRSIDGTNVSIVVLEN